MPRDPIQATSAERDAILNGWRSRERRVTLRITCDRCHRGSRIPGERSLGKQRAERHTHRRLEDGKGGRSHKHRCKLPLERKGYYAGNLREGGEPFQCPGHCLT